MERNELVNRFGEEIVNKLDNEGCDFTNRVLPEGNEYTEFTANVKTQNEDGIPVTLTAYYYQKTADVDAVENLDELNWEIDHYEVC